MFHLLWEAIIGLIVGALAKFIMPGKDPGGILVTMALQAHCSPDGSAASSAGTGKVRVQVSSRPSSAR